MKPNYTMLGCAEIMKDSACKMQDASTRLFKFSTMANYAAKVEKYPHGDAVLMDKYHLEEVVIDERIAKKYKL